MGYFIARVVGLKKSQVAGSVKHQYRLQETLNADPKRRHLNVDFGPQTPESMYEAADARYKSEGITPDISRNYLAEVLVTMSHKALSDAEALKMFQDSRKELEKKYGKDNVLGGSYQFDEATPHAAFFIVPIAYREKKTVKKSVIAKGIDKETGKRNRKIIDVEVKAGAHQSYKELFGGIKYNLSKWQDEMYAAIGKNYGLERGIKGSTAKHQTVANFYKTFETLKTPKVQLGQVKPYSFWQKLDPTLEPESVYVDRVFSANKAKLTKAFAPINGAVINFKTLEKTAKDDKQRIEVLQQREAGSQAMLEIAARELETLRAENKTLKLAYEKVKNELDSLVSRLQSLGLYEKVMAKTKGMLEGIRQLGALRDTVRELEKTGQIAPGQTNTQTTHKEDDPTMGF